MAQFNLFFLGQKGYFQLSKLFSLRSTYFSEPFHIVLCETALKIRVFDRLLLFSGTSLLYTRLVKIQDSAALLAQRRLVIVKIFKSRFQEVWKSKVQLLKRVCAFFPALKKLITKQKFIDYF